MGSKLGVGYSLWYECNTRVGAGRGNSVCQLDGHLQGRSYSVLLITWLQEVGFGTTSTGKLSGR